MPKAKQKIKNGDEIVMALWRFENGLCPENTDNTPCTFNATQLAHKIKSRLGQGAAFDKGLIDGLANAPNSATSDTLWKIETAYGLPKGLLADCTIPQLSAELQNTLLQDSLNNPDTITVGVIALSKKQSAHDSNFDVSFVSDKSSNHPTMNVHLTVSLDPVNSHGWVWGFHEIWLEAVLPPDTRIRLEAPSKGYKTSKSDDIEIIDASRGGAWKVIIRNKDENRPLHDQILKNWLAGIVVDGQVNDVISIQLTAPRLASIAVKSGVYKDNIKGSPIDSSPANLSLVVNSIFATESGGDLQKATLSEEKLHIISESDF